MQMNGNTSSENEKNTVSLDSIIDEYGNAASEDKNQSRGDAMKKLDEMFKEKQDDLDWIDNIMSDKKEEESSEEGAKVAFEDEDVPEESFETEEIIEAENSTAPYEESEEDEQDTVVESVGKVLPCESEDEENDGKTKIHSVVKNEDDGAVEFDEFENEDAEPVKKRDADKKKSEEVNKFLGALFGIEKSQDEVREEDDAEPEEETEVKEESEHKKIAKELGVYEEIDMSDVTQVEEGRKKYYLKKCHALIALLGTAVFMLLTLYCELAPVASLPHIALLSPENTAIYALIDLQLLCFGAMCVLDSLVSGLYALRDRRFSPASCALVIFASSALQAVCSAVLCKDPSSLRLFCCVGAFALLMLALYDYLKASADDKVFKIASSPSNKFGAFEVGTDSPECQPFVSHIDLENAKVITVKKGVTYEGFVGRNERRPDNERKLGKLTAIVSIVALVTGVFMGIATKSVYQGITSAVIVMTCCVPFNIFIVSALPKFLAAQKGKEIGAALVGQNASEEYKGLSVIAFEDTEVFLPKDVRISSIKTYNGMALDEAVVIMSKIYSKVGGPLSKIFAKMVDIKSDSNDTELKRVYPDALELSVAGREISIATASYLASNGIRILSDNVDAAFEQSHGSILFMVSGARVLAKFYIKYSINPTFEKTLRELHEANLCVGVKTLDPCITNDLIFGCLEKANYALSVVKGKSAADIPNVSEKVNSGVVALGSVHNFLEMLLLCERTGRNVKINNIIKLISAVACILLSVGFVLTNSSLNVMFCIVLQLFWLLPVTVISYFNK